jgi:hypothetical protein
MPIQLPSGITFGYCSYEAKCSLTWPTICGRSHSIAADARMNSSAK